MHLTKITQPLYDGNRNVCGFDIEAIPPFSENFDASTALYEQVWHRLRRDLIYRTKLHNGPTPFDAIISVSKTLTEDRNLRAQILFNNAHPQRADNAKNAKRMIRRLDKTIFKLINQGTHDIALCNIVRKFETDSNTAIIELKSLLKVYCRAQGFFINQNDLNRALISAKDRRRQAYKAAHPEYFKK